MASYLVQYTIYNTYTRPIRLLHLRDMTGLISLSAGMYSIHIQHVTSYNRTNSLLRTPTIEVHGITRPTPQRHMEVHNRQHELVPCCTAVACPPLQKTCRTCTHGATSSAASPNCLASQAANWTTRGRSPACGQRPPEQ